MASAEAALQSDLTGVDTVTIECYSGTVTESTMWWDGWTTNNTPGNYPVIKAVAGHEHNGVEGAGYIQNVTSSWNWAVRIPLGIRDITIQTSTDGPSIEPQTTSGLLLDLNRVIFKNTGVSSFSEGIGGGTGVTLNLRNCLFTGYGRTIDINASSTGYAEK
jgi:hypothetical protein